MYSKSSLKISVILFLFIVILTLSSCTANGTKMEFSFNTGSPSNSIDVKTIYINNDMDKLVLNAELKIDSGDAIVKILSVFDNEVIWNGSYQEDSNFIIELLDLEENSEYLLKVETTQSKKVSLIVTSDDKLVKDKEKPEKYIIEKK